MEAWVESSVHALLATLALPKVGLSAIFVVSFVSATLLPLGSEPAVFGFVKLAPQSFWPAIFTATVGNTLGGMVTYAMGAGAQTTYERWREKRTTVSPPGGRWHNLARQWAHRLGPAALFFSWLPGVGDPLCAVAGWLRLPFWPSVFYMAFGKFLRYLIMTTVLLWMF